MGRQDSAHVAGPPEDGAGYRFEGRRYERQERCQEERRRYQRSAVMTDSGHSASLAKGALAGLLGGLAASFLMNQFMTGIALVTDGRKPSSADPQRTKQLMTARRKRFHEMADPTGEVSDSIARRLL